MNEVVLLGAAYLTGLLANRLSLPPLVGYLLAGYVLHALGISAPADIGRLADTGIQILLFTVGLKLKPSSLVRREVLSVGGLHLLIMAIVSALVFLSLHQQGIGGLILGISLSFSSTVLAIKVLEDSGELSSLHGRDVLSILILQDIVAIGLLGFTDGQQPTPWALLLLGLPILRPIAHRILSASSAPELKLLLGVLLALAGGALAERVGVAADIGALLMGVMLASHQDIDALSNKLWGLKELFLVAFFLQIGLTDLPDSEQIINALGLLLLLPVQGSLFFGLFILAGMRARTSFISSLALMTYSEFALITSASVVHAGLLAPEWQAIISLAVAGSLALAAPLNRFSHSLFDWVEPILIRFESKASRPDHLPEHLGAAEWLVIGMGRTGQATYQSLVGQGERVVGLDSDPTVLEGLRSTGRRVVYGDVEDSELWSSLPLSKIKGIVLTVPDFNMRCLAIAQLRNRGFAGKIGTVCFHTEKEAKLVKLGASFVVQPLVEAGNQLAMKLLRSNSM